MKWKIDRVKEGDGRSFSFSALITRQSMCVYLPNECPTSVTFVVEYVVMAFSTADKMLAAVLTHISRAVNSCWRCNLLRLFISKTIVNFNARRNSWEERRVQ